MTAESLTVVDNRTGLEYTLPIVDGTIRATDLRQLSAAEGDGGLMSYDPAYLNTASCRSAITYIDGDAGILRYRGYPIEQVAEKAGFLEIAYLLLEGELPTAPELAQWEDDIRTHTYVHTSVTKFLEGFRYDAHPMGMLLGAVGALSTFYPDAKRIDDAESRYLQRVRLMAKLPTHRGVRVPPCAGAALRLPAQRSRLRRQLRQHDVRPPRSRTSCCNVRSRSCLILHADHEQNCSTSAVRGVGSSHVDPFSAISAGIAALYGPLHGGANEAVLAMLDEIGDSSRVPAFVEG